jgi:hypothetical protein
MGVNISGGNHSPGAWYESDRQQCVESRKGAVPGMSTRPFPFPAIELVSGDYYSALGVHATLGRTLSTDDDRAHTP